MFIHHQSGGKTANCEWEFLTGNSTRFLPTGAVPYQQYIKKSTTSLVSILNSNGYSTTAFHPYNKEGYSRNVIYPLLGFKEAKFNDTMENINYIRYGDYADDLSTYKNIVSLFENKEKEEKIFNFTVTMQNHLSYDDKNFKNTVFLSGRDKEKYSEVNQYLSLVKLSDDAFKYLVNYFENYEEPTIIMMFGDHQPGLVNWYEEIFGQTEEEYNERKYIVPMVMWANFDIKEQKIEDISMNYLSNILLENAGIEKTDYIKYLDKLYKKYPVITANTYQDNKGKFYEYEEELPEDLKLYEYIQYNNMFDDNKLNIYNRDTKEQE
ncbi:MAG: LTA synthase family protein [Clostridia bacterium]|nr:LTA synthase family protein [Clostridia bacterium]